MSNNKIILVRHGESEEDKDPSMKSAVDDPAKLTEKGIQQAKEKAEILSSEYEGFRKHIYYRSPSVRVKQTTEVFLQRFEEYYNPLVIEVPQIRNLNWGSTNLQNVKEVERERYRVGVLNFQFPGGDYTPEYVSQISNFCSYVSRSISKDSGTCITIFTHGFAMRVLVKEFVGIGVDEFRYFSNPKNCFSCILDVDQDNSGVKFRLREPFPKINFQID